MTYRVAIAYTFHDRDWQGGRNYFASLLHAMRMLRPAEFSFVFVTGRRTQTTLPEEFEFLEVVRTPLLDRKHPAWLLRQCTLRMLDTDPLLARLLRRLRIDLLSHSDQLGPRPGLKTAMWLYDFQFMHLPEYWQPRHIRWVEQRYRAACRNCDALIVSSHHALSDLERFDPRCRIPRYVLQFVSNPVDHAAIVARDELLQRYSLPADYFYLPNQFWTNKNHRLALHALQALRDRGIEATIVCTGKNFDGRKPGYFAELMEYRSRAGLEDRFRVLGLVPYRDTQALMAHARAVINPSLFEGWSTTVEEAKTFHKTMLLSDIPVHREQSPEFGRFFPVDAPGVLADLMQRELAAVRREFSAATLEDSYRERLERFGASYLSILRATLAPGPIDATPARAGASPPPQTQR
jgi:glycosyltransferase involved in cell wall biosynthesis